jgi:ketosteroid isomerase-like protein
MYRPFTSSLPGTRPFRDVQSQICDLTQDFVTAFNTGNYDQAAGMFASNGVLMVPGHEAAYDQKAVERLLRQIGEAEYCGLRLATTRVEYSGDMAMEIGQFSAATRKADGTMTPGRGKYVKVWRRLGAWLIIADCWSRAVEAVGDQAA